MIHPHIPHYFSYHLGKETKEIYWQASLFNLGLAMAFIFEPIYLYKLGYGLSEILLFYGFVYIAFALFIFAGATVASEIGFKHSILISSFFYILYWLALYQLRNYPDLFVVAPVLFALQKSFFWPAYDAEIALSSAKKQRGREIGAMFSIIEMMTMLGPVLGGWLLSLYGFKVLFMVSSLLVLFSVYPLFKSAEVYSKHIFKFKNFINIFKKYPWNFLGYWGYAEDLMIMTLWPIVVYLTVTEVFQVGVVATFASIIASVLMLYIGKLSDKLRKKDLVQISALFYSMTWVFRFLATKVWSVLLFDVLGRTGKGMINVSTVSFTYELAGSKGPDRAIAYSVFCEFSLAIGKIVTALGGIVILELTGSIAWVFVFVGILTTFYGLLRK